MLGATIATLTASAHHRRRCAAQQHAMRELAQHYGVTIAAGSISLEPGVEQTLDVDIDGTRHLLLGGYPSHDRPAILLTAGRHELLTAAERSSLRQQQEQTSQPSPRPRLLARLRG